MYSSFTMDYHIYVLLLLLLSKCSVFSTEVLNVGTSLYTKSDTTKFWTEQESIKLQGRKIVEQLFPTRIPDGDEFIKYMQLIVDKSGIIDSDQRRKQIMVMVADAIGGYMYGVLLPKIKMSYYDGRVNFGVTSKLYGLMRKIKFVLETDGRGWITSMENIELPSSYTSVEDYNNYDIGDAEFAENSCEELHLEPFVVGGDMVVPIPTFDDNQQPGSMVVPFAVGKRLFSMDMPGTTDKGRPSLLARYYRLAVGCTSAAPDRFQRDVHVWLNTAVVPLLANRHRWYPVLAGASRVVRAATSAVSYVKRPKRNATEPVNKDDKPICDELDVLPNTNMFLLILLLSFTYTWLSFSVLSIHKIIRFMLGPLTASLRQGSS